MTATRTDAVRLTCEAARRHALEADRAARFPVEALAAMRRTGLLGLMVPAEYGGGGGSLTSLVDVTMELGRTDLSVALIFAMHCQQVVALARCAGDRLRRQLLPDAAGGRLYLASVTTEPGKGGDLLTAEAQARLLGGQLRIDREAPIVTGGRHADGFLVTMRTPGEASPSQIDLVYAARDQLRLEVIGEWLPLGMRATESVPMRLAGAVPEWQVVGERGGFRRIAGEVFGPLAHVGWAAAWLGTAAGACSRVIGQIRRRSHPGRFDPASELPRIRLASVRARLDSMHALLRHTLAVLDSHPDMASPPVQLLVNALKTETAEGCFGVVDELMELAGLEHGYLDRSSLGLERAFRDLRSASLNYGNDRLRLACGSLALMDSGVRLA